MVWNLNNRAKNPFFITQATLSQEFLLMVIMELRINELKTQWSD